MLKTASITAALFSAITIAGLTSNGPAYADRNIPSDGDALSVPKDGIIDDTAAAWVWTGMISNSGDMLHGGTDHAGGPQSSGTLAFHGTGIEVYTAVGPTVIADGRAHKAGSMDIFIDGKLQSTFSMKDTSANFEVNAARVTGLSDGNHVLELRANGGWFSVDYVKIPQPGQGVSGENLPNLDVFDYSKGFPADADLQLNGTAHIEDSALILTDGHTNQMASVFTHRPVSVKKFKTKFRLQFLNATADGIIFCIQYGSPTAIGKVGENIGFGGMNKSMAVKFDIFDNTGEGTCSTGLYFNGFTPTSPFIDLTPTPIKFRSGHPIDVSLDYDGKVLTVTETDAVSGGSTSQDYPVDIPGMMGTRGYAGFTGSTGDLTATQVIRSWSYKAIP